MSLAERLAVSATGEPDGAVMVFVHGFGCDQHMWRHVAPAFEADHRVVLFDLPGMGGSAPDSYDVRRHSSLDGYADDVLALLRDLDLREVVLVAHSVSAMIAALAQVRAPELFDRLVMVGPSARYLDDEEAGYIGGLNEQDVAELLDLMENNHFGWQAPLASLVVNDTDRADLAAEMEENFCRTHPDIARRFAAVTFLGDNRADLPKVSAPVLILQSRHDAIAPVTAGRFVHDAIAGSRFDVVETNGHCPQLSAPEATIEAIRSFVRS